MTDLHSDFKYIEDGWRRQNVEEEIYMSHFAYACKTEQQNGISHLISKLLCTLNSSLRDHLFMLQNEVYADLLVLVLSCLIRHVFLQ